MIDDRAADDIDLFVDLSCWVAPHLPDPGLWGLLSWLGAWLRPEALRSIRQLLPLDAPAHIAAEHLLAAYLRGAKGVARQASFDSDVVERSIDWPGTYSRSATRPPFPYLVREERLDPWLDRALHSLAQQWGALLCVYDFGERGNALLVASGNRVPATPWSPAHTSRLRQGGRESRVLADAIAAALGFWRLPSRPEEVGGRIRELARRFAATADNVNDLLEVSVRLAVARAALEASASDYAQPDVPWHLRSLVPRADRKPVIELGAGNLRCRITKGRPQTLERGRWRDCPDMLVGAGEHVGLKPTGNQPDVVLTFWLDGGSDVATVLGDAKRNVTGTGASYLAASVEVAAVYAVSYRRPLGLRFAEDGTSALTGPVLPAVTLFVRRGMARAQGAEQERLAALRSLPPRSWLECFDMDRDFPAGAPSVVIGAWMGAIGRQACAYLAREAP